jgi:hypothetical protein
LWAASGPTVARVVKEACLHANVDQVGVLRAFDDAEPGTEYEITRYRQKNSNVRRS